MIPIYYIILLFLFNNILTCIIITNIINHFIFFRIFLQYHTWKQVIYGALFGIIIGTIWFTIINVVLTPYFPTVISWYV